MKNTILITYLIVGLVVCGWYTIAAANGWKAPNFGIAKAFSGSGRSRGGYYGGRSYGGSWGGGK